MCFSGLSSAAREAASPAHLVLVVLSQRTEIYFHGLFEVSCDCSFVWVFCFFLGMMKFDNSAVNCCGNQSSWSY